MAMQSGFMSRMMSEREKTIRLRELDKNVIRMFLSYLKPQLRLLVLVLLITTVVAAVNTVVPLLSKIAIDDYIVPKDPAGLHYVLLAFVVLYGIFWLASYWSGYLSIKLGQKVIAAVRKDLFQKTTALSLDYFSHKKTGDIMSRLTHDVNTLSEFLTSGIINLLTDLLTLGGIITIMFMINLKLAVVVLVTIPIIFSGTLLIGRHMRKAYSSVREKVGKLNSGVEENISGIRVVQAMSQESGNINTFEKLNKDNLAAHIKAVVVSAIFFPFMSMTGTLGTALVVLVGGLMIVNGETGATIGLVMAFMGYANRFFMPLRDLSQIYGVYQNAAASAERIHDLFSEKSEIKQPENPQKLPVPLQGEIAVRGVDFSYARGQPVLQQIDAVFAAGKTTAIVGPTGAGKSTLIKLIARLYEVGKGKITIDGIDVRSIEFSELRQSIMLVPQDVFLFAGSVLDNIRYGDPRADDAIIKQAAVDACADAFIQTLPQGYETQVGEGGVRLSGGQRQLIAFARAILANRPILILDEATSSVDAMTERLIQQALERLLPGRTAIIVAHRFTTLRQAEHIVVLDQGKLAGSGRHTDLLADCPLYQSLYEKQWLPTVSE